MRTGEPLLRAHFKRFVQAVGLCRLAPSLRRRLARAYGARIDLVLATGEPGAEVAPGLHEAKLNYLHAHEWARSADDVLRRRSKLGLHFSVAERTAQAGW